VKLAKKMIRDGTLPCPEDAQEQLAERLRRDRLGEPMQPIQQPLGEPMEILAPQEEPATVIVSVARSKGRKRP
jgi:hypothetical protein